MGNQTIPLFLGPVNSPIFSFLKLTEKNVIQTEKPVSISSSEVIDTNFLVSHGYRHIIRPNVLNHYGSNTANLHISLLPWNRGADPNLWSFLDNTPTGVTIHQIDEGLDTGAILLQEPVNIDRSKHTLASSYQLLTHKLVELFIEGWPKIKAGKITAVAQDGKGSYHSSKDKTLYEHLLTNGWDTPLVQITK